MNEDLEDSDERKVFMFAGYTTLPKIKEKEELMQKIALLGGDVDGSPNWDQNCTHVIADKYELFTGKVLAALASGKWVVTRRFVDRSHKRGSWSNSKPFVCDQTVLLHRKRWFENGGCFRGMKVLFLMENEMKRNAYTDVVKAGGGSVLDNWDIDQLLHFKPGPSELTHIVVDPFILSERDHRFIKFKKWQEYAKQVWDPDRGETLPYIYYKYFFDYLSAPLKNVRPQEYSIYIPKVMQIARNCGDLKLPERDSNSQPSQFRPVPSRSSILDSAASKSTAPRLSRPGAGSSPVKETLKRNPLAEESSNKRPRTEIKTRVLEANVVELEDSDDDIQILEQKLREEEGSTKRTYFDLTPRDPAQLITVDSSVELSGDESERDDRGLSTDDDAGSVVEEIPHNDVVPKFPAPQPVSGEDSDGGSDIEILEIASSRPQTQVSSKKSKMFKRKLQEMEAREERRRKKQLKEEQRKAIRASVESRGSGSPEPRAPEDLVVQAQIVPAEEIPEITGPMQRLSLENPQSDEAKLLNRVLATVLERQLATDECIEISHAAARTARYDKNKECSVANQKLVPVGALVKEEFYNRYIEKKDQVHRQRGYSSDGEEAESINFTLEDEANNYVALLEILEYLKCFTNLRTHPTSSILNVIMRDFIINQASLKVALRSCRYIDQFIFLHLGREKVNREDWLNLILSALRDNQSFNQFEEFSLESSRDLESCWRFFSMVLENATARSLESNRIMLSLLVKICQRDFELWWKHHRRTEHKDDRELSYPILFYLLEGRRNLIENINRTILKHYRIVLEKDEDMTDIRKLVSMCAMLLAHLDFKDKNGPLSRTKNLKNKMASKIQQIFAKSNLNSDELFIELNLIKPSWLSLMVCRKYLSKEKEKDIKGLKDVVDQLQDLSTSCDTDMFSCLDTLIPKMIGTMHLHTIIRTCWFFQTHEATGYPVFSGMSRLEKDPHRAPKVLRLKNDVSFLKSQIVEDANSLITFHNQERSVDMNAGVMQSAFFKMYSLDKF